MSPSQILPSLLGKMNEREVLRIIQINGPSSRAEVARRSGISAPTVSKAVASLLESGLLEEEELPERRRGRPAKILRLAQTSAQVLGIALDAGYCEVVTSGLDAQLTPEFSSRFVTPGSYECLLEKIVQESTRLSNLHTGTVLGAGISIPGLIDYRQQKGVLSPNLPITNNRSPSQDLQERLGVKCVMLQECHALCLAERHFGHARGQDDFAMLDVTTGVGLGVMSGGRLLTGYSGLAGEIGHITVDVDGRQCGCGNYGCLETVASDSALLYAASKALNRRVDFDGAMAAIQSGELRLIDELEKFCRYMAIGWSAVINLFNPSTLYVYGRMFDVDPSLFDRIREYTHARTLNPSFQDCTIVQASGNKRLGALAGIIEFVTNSVVPELNSDPTAQPLTGVL